MARRYSKKHLFWLLPSTVALLLAVALAVGLTLARQHGWNWQGLAWDEGPVLQRLAWRDGGCLRFVARDMRLNDVWPLRLSVASVAVPSCADSAQTNGGAGFALPAAPPLDIFVDALRFRDYPALRIAVHHRGSRWWAQASIKGSDLQAAYDAANGLWQMAGRVDVARLRHHFSGTLNVKGSGYWHPGASEADERFGGQLRITGTQLGQAQGGPRGDLMATVAWEGEDWTLDAALDQPVALGQGWVMQPGQGIHASGTGLTVRKATATLVAQGPQGRALLSLRSHAGRLGSGQGRIVLNHGLSGRIDFSWVDGRLLVQPFAVTGPNDVILALDEAAAIPLAREGQIASAMTVRHGDAIISTTESHLSWSDSGVRWRGAVVLEGHWNGYQLDGGWSGAIGRDGLQGEPLVAILDGTDLHVRARLPVAGLWPPDWPLVAQLDGRFMGQDFGATVSAARTEAGWGGDVQARSQLSQMDRGGELALRGQWQWRDGLVLSPGTELRMAQALKGAVVIQPIALTAVTPVSVKANGIVGRFRLDAAGMTAARWRLPPLHGDLALGGWRIDANFRVPDWNATLSVAGRDLSGTSRGTFSAELPLQPAVSRGLGVITRDGTLAANGQWRVDDAPEITGRLQARDVELDWGSITARGVQADLDANWRPGKVHISTRVPLTVAKLETGVPVTAISLGLDSDLQTWRFRDIEASMLGGRLTAKTLTWPSTAYQPVMLTGIDVAQLAALQSKPVVEVSGRVGGTLPLLLGRDAVAIRNGRLKNETPLALSIPQTEGVIALKKTNQAVDMALDALSPLRIKELSARINMTADGWMKAAMTIKGVNPQRKLPIVLNYTHQENMFELLRSLRIGDRVINAVTDG